jgi:hypothetical protein
MQVPALYVDTQACAARNQAIREAQLGRHPRITVDADFEACQMLSYYFFSRFMT